MGSVVSADFNGDGFLDLASAGGNKIAWYKNLDGKGNFGEQIVVTTNANGAECVAVGDVDDDGFVDLLSASKSKIAWYKNDGAGTFSGEIIIFTENNYEFSSVATGDFNKDGFLDVVSSSILDNKIAWYNNTDGKGSFSKQIIITTNAKKASSVVVADFNNDGFPDVASASSGDSTIAWYNNTDGKGTFSQQIVVTTKAIDAKSVTANHHQKN